MVAGITTAQYSQSPSARLNLFTCELARREVPFLLRAPPLIPALATSRPLFQFDASTRGCQGANEASVPYIPSHQYMTSEKSPAASLAEGMKKYMRPPSPMFIHLPGSEESWRSSASYLS